MDTQDNLAVATGALLTKFLEGSPQYAATRLETLPVEEAAGILQDVPLEVAIPVWSALSTGFTADLLQAVPESWVLEIIAGVDPGKAAKLVLLLEPTARASLVSRLDPAVSRELQTLMSYPEDSAGHFMDVRFLAFRGDTRVAEALAILRRKRAGKAVTELRVIDEDGRLKSLVDIKDLALAQADQSLDSIAHGIIAFVYPTDPKDEIVSKLEKYGVEELPVIDLDNHLVGIIRRSELIEALMQEVSVDIQTMVGVSKDERAKSTAWFAIRKRMPWLQVNLLTAFLAASVVGMFENTIATFTALAVLLPVVAGQSGNTGAQALAVTMRGIALREISVRDWSWVAWKEATAGFWNGIMVAFTCGVGVYLWSGDFSLVLVIASSMVIAMVAAGLAGALVPIGLARLGQDPAVASSIVLTTVTDITGFFTFLGIATLLLTSAT